MAATRGRSVRVALARAAADMADAHRRRHRGARRRPATVAVTAENGAGSVTGHVTAPAPG